MKHKLPLLYNKSNHIIDKLQSKILNYFAPKIKVLLDRNSVIVDTNQLY